VRNKTADMIKKVHNYLVDHNYATAEQVAEHCALSKASIYRIVRIMREQGIGVIPATEGYILSKYAKKNDDVRFIRTLNGRRTSDYFSLAAAEKDIRNRWNSIAERRDLQLLLPPLLSTKPQILEKGRQVLLSKSE
jgi:Lhr-like helicase